VFIVARRASDVIGELFMARRLDREGYEDDGSRSRHPICLMTLSRAG
jgi:hypothetical protein